MSLSTEELTKQAAELRKNGCVDEAIAAARRAVELDPEDPDAWWQLGLSVEVKEGAEASRLYVERTVQLADGFAYGWFKLGECHKHANRLEEAVECFEKAVDRDDDRIDALEELIAAYGNQKSEQSQDKLIRALKILDRKEMATSHTLNLLGNAYYGKKDYNRAIECYRRVAGSEFSAVGYYNLGLAFNAPEISQDVDAIDAWRRALARDPDYEKAKTRLEEVLPRLLALRDRVAPKAVKLIGPDEWYKHYISPFELLDLDDYDSAAELSVKAIQRSKKLLLQEIELESGNVSWLPGLRIDRSRAIHVADKLLNDREAKWHWAVFNCKPLLNFLTRGDIRHFLADESYSPLVALLAIEEDPAGFESVIGEALAAQFNASLTAAINAWDSDVVEALLDGRRWVAPHQEDICFEGCMRAMENLIEPLRRLRETANKRLVSDAELREILSALDFGKIITVLPASFRDIRSEVVSLIQGIAITACNDHNDKDLAKRILHIARPLAAKSSSLLHAVDEDLQTLDELIEDDSKYDAALTFKDKVYSITRTKVSFNDRTLDAEGVQSLRWGITLTGDSYSPTYEFILVVGGGDGAPLTLNWTSSKDIEKQRGLFDTMVKAALHYLLPKIMQSMRDGLAAGRSYKIGSSTATKSGVSFEKSGWFSSKVEHVEWCNLRSRLANGDVIFTDMASGKVQLVASLANVDNLAALHFIVNDNE